MNKDLTVGKPAPVLWRFCLPLFGSVIFQQLYNIADSLVAGKLIGEDALAAVGNSYEITLLFIAFGFGCNIGTSVIVSQLFGAKRNRDVRTAVSTAFLSVGAVCLVLMAAGLLLCTPLMRLIKTPENIFADSRLYLDIYLWGLPFVFYYNVSNGIFSALGDSRTPFYFLAVSSLSNIGMDVLFVASFHMGVAGVAWATFLCQGVSCLLAVYLVLRRMKGLGSEKAPLFSWPLLRRIAGVAVPSILQQSFISVGNIVIQGAVNSFSSAVTAGYSAAIKLNNLVITSLTTIGNGVSNYSAQNLGAGKLRRVHEGWKAGLLMVLALCVPLTALYFFASRQMIHIFLDSEEGRAMEVGVMFLRVVSPFYFVVAAKLVSDGVLRGTGHMRQFMAATFTDLILRVVLALILSRPFGPTGIWSAWPIGWGIAAVMSLLFCRAGGWHRAEPAPDEDQA